MEKIVVENYQLSRSNRELRRRLREGHTAVAAENAELHSKLCTQGVGC